MSLIFLKFFYPKVLFFIIKMKRLFWTFFFTSFAFFSYWVFNYPTWEVSSTSWLPLFVLEKKIFFPIIKSVTFWFWYLISFFVSGMLGDSYLNTVTKEINYLGGYRINCKICLISLRKSFDCIKKIGNDFLSSLFWDMIDNSLQ